MHRIKTLFSLVAAAFVGVAGAEELPLGWTGEQMDSAGALVRADDGELVYAYTAADTSLTVNGVTFAPWGNGDGPNNANVTLAYPAGVSYHARKTDGNDEGASGDYGTLLKTVYTYNSLGDYSLTFNNLEAGKRYLAQIIVHYNNGNPVLTVKDTSVTVKPYVSYPPDQWKYGGSLVCVFVAEGSSQTFTLTYSNDTPCTFNAVQLRCLDAAPVETDPVIGTATVKVKGAKATVSLANVKLGTDDKCVAATKYSVVYKLNGGAAVTALENQTASAVDFEITGLADGEYAGEVWIVTDTPKTSASKAIAFKINTQLPEDGWEAVAMDSTGSQIVSDEGEFVYGYAQGTNYGTMEVGGVTFTTFYDNGDFASKQSNVSVSPAFPFWAFGFGTEGTSGDYAHLLDYGFKSSEPGDLKYTLKNLEIGESYLVQLIVHWHDQGCDVTAPDGTTKIKQGGDGWTYGGSLIGRFTAMDTSYEFTVNYVGTPSMNAIQVRKIDGLTPSKSEPVIGSVTATVANRSTTATISLADVQLGTDDEGVAATKYAVVYSLNGAAEVTNLVEQTASSAEFAINGLADGDYTCAVKIVTDKGKASAAKNAAFTIDTALHPVAPAIGSVKAVLSGSKATIKLADIVLGTNAEGSEAAASYTLSYTLGGAETTVGSGLTGAATQFVLTGLAEGSHTCSVKIVTDKNREATGSVTFKIVPMPVGTDVLKISEICPRPDAFDPNGRESGWIELWNSGESDIDLADYEIVRVNRGKELKSKGTPLASRIVPAGGYTLIYTSEEYGNVDSGKVKIYDNDVMVYPVKVNPKKFPLVALYKGDTLLEQFVVPVDLPDNQSFAPAGGLFPEFAGNAGGTALTDKWHIQDSAAVTRVILPTITPGAVNNRTDEIPYGPNAGPLYGIKHGLSDWKPFPMAKVGENYPVTMAINPLSAAEGDEIVSVKLLYRLDYAHGDKQVTEKINSVEAMTKGEMTAEEGQLWTAEIPCKLASGDNEGIYTFKAGHLLSWAAQVTDKAGNTWRTPSFRNLDDGYGWYGTIIEPNSDQLSVTLPTWHIFVAPQGEFDMDRQYDSGSYVVDRNRWPCGVRCGIYDSQTSNYYDNVRIDGRGNTTLEFQVVAKKSHGMRFSKVHPMQCTDPFSGERITVRKTSVLAEYQDPSNLRSDLSMHLRRLAGQDVPFGYPIRMQRNGKFYQLGHHSNRLTDEYITDYLGLDERGCLYKNIGTVGGDRNTGLKAGDPTWGVPVLPEEWTVDQAKAVFDTFKDPIAGDTQYVNNNRRLPNSSTNGVVRLYDLPYWFNFLALSRLTQECDDDTSTLNVYYDRFGNGAWRPLAYDLHQSFGVFWAGSDMPLNRPGLLSTNDTEKCHPFHGGLHAPENPHMGNRAYEGIYQTAKFRRLLVRRLRTLMDEILKEPGTPKEETPFWRDYVVPMYNAMKADNDEDRKDERKIDYRSPLYVWPGTTPLTFEQAVDDMWDNYVVPRRNHFYVTHSITNTAKQIGYGTDLNAGIPLAQSPIADLKAGFSVETIEGGVVVRNLNAETVDMSGWKLSGAVSYTFPAGSVIDQAFGGQPGEVFVVTDRTNYIARLEAAHVELTDQVILGNATPGIGDACGLKDAKGELVFSSIDIPEENTFYYTGTHEGDIVINSAVWPDVTNECTVIFDNASVNGRLILANDIRVALVLSNDTVNTIKTIEGPGAHLRLAGADGELKLEGAGTLVSVSNLVVKSGTLSVRTTSIAAADEGNKTKVIEVLGHVKQTGGVIDVDIGLETTNQIYGIYLKNKDLKDKSGDNLGIIYAEFSGGEFKATVGGTKSAAIYVNKGSVDTKFEDDFSANVTLVGPEPRFVNSAGDIKFRNGSFAVTGTVDAVSARVFKTNKKISVTDGLFQIEVTGGGSEIFSTSIDPEDPKTSSVTFAGGTFELSADDDCVSADTLIQIDGGLFYAVSAANDVFDSNGNMTINGGTIMAYALADGHETFDVDAEASGNHGTLTVNGGTIFATGGADAKWPVKVVSGTGVVLLMEEGLYADGYSGKYLSLAGSGSVTYTAKLPAMSGNCAIFATCPGFGGTPTLSGAAPESGSQNFHDLYISKAEVNNQEYLRMYEIYGSTAGGGDTGEYIVLTNASDKVVTLKGVKINVEKLKDWTNSGEKESKCLFTLTGGTVAPNGVVILKQEDYASAGWTKITNGDLYFYLKNVAGETIQSGELSFSLHEKGADGTGKALRAATFEKTIASTDDDWKVVDSGTIKPQEESDPDAPVIGGGDIYDPIVVASDKVTIKISNAGIGFTYGYKKSVTLEGLATAEPEWLAAPADEAGVLAIAITKDPAEPSCFYQIVVK